MARFGKIYAGPTTENQPQVVELPAAVAIIPGSMIVATGGQFALAVAATRGKVWIAQDNYLTMENVETPWGVGESTIGMELLDEQFFNARVAAGANLQIGTPLALGPAGTLVVAGVSAFVVATSDEVYNNTTGEVQLARVRPVKGYISAAA